MIGPAKAAWDAPTCFWGRTAHRLRGHDYRSVEQENVTL
jgi:hypothetical protein